MRCDGGAKAAAGRRSVVDGADETHFSLSLLRVLWCELSNLIFTIESVYNF